MSIQDLIEQYKINPQAVLDQLVQQTNLNPAIVSNLLEYKVGRLSESSIRGNNLFASFGNYQDVANNYGGYGGLADYLLGGGQTQTQSQAKTSDPYGGGGMTGGKDVLVPTQTLNEPKPTGFDEQGKPVYGQTLGDVSGGQGGSTSVNQGYYKVAVPKTTQNPGGFDVYNAQGQKMTYESLPKGPDGKPLMNLDALPVMSSSTPPGGNLGGSGGISSSVDFSKPDWYKAYGISDDIWNQLDNSTKAFVQSSAQLVQGQYDQGMINVSINADLLNKALVSAQNDPNIISKYGDALKMDVGGVQRNLAMVNADYAQSEKQLNIQQQQERKALAEQESAAGRAYSGFRQQAESQLATTQSGVIESSRRTAQQKLEQLGSGLEQKYGTAGLGQFGNLALGGQTYNPYGGITGSVEGQKKADIEARQQQIYNMEKLA